MNHIKPLEYKKERKVKGIDAAKDTTKGEYRRIYVEFIWIDGDAFPVP